MSKTKYSELQKEDNDDIELPHYSADIEDAIEDESFHDEPTLEGDLVGEDSPDNDDKDDVYAKEQLKLHLPSNLGVPLNYLMVGLVQGLTYPLLNVYPLDLGATEAQQTTLLTLKDLPSCFKILYGFWSDNVPIAGLRRKPYLYLGWCMSSVSLLPLLLFTNLTLPLHSVDTTEQTNATISFLNNATTEINDSVRDVVAPPDAPGMPLLCGCFFLWANGLWFSDVIGDSLVAEKAKYETHVNRGNTQAICYILRGVGFVAMAPVSSLLYSSLDQGPYLVILATVLLPLLLFPAIGALYERPLTHIMETRDQVAALWNTACSQAVWQPMGFVFLFLACFVTNAAWKQFLETVLGFTPNQLNSLMIVGSIMAFVGVVWYKLYLSEWSWRTLFVMTFVGNGIFSALQLLLISGHTVGLPPFIFALGDDSMKDLILGIQYLPMVILMVNLVPSGIEGASYALFTTTWNVAQSLSNSLSTMLLAIWDVSKEALQQGKMSGLTKLTILTSIIQAVPVLFVRLLPHSADDLKPEVSSSSFPESATINTSACKGSMRGSSSRYGGAIYLGIVFVALVWTIFVDVMNVLHPGWMGET